MNHAQKTQELKPPRHRIVSAPLIFSWRPTPKISGLPPVNYSDLLSAGSALIKGGVNLIPVNDQKTPIGKWKRYQTERATTGELEGWCKRKSAHGLAMIGGEISKGLTILDFDIPGFFERFVDKVKRHREVRELAYLVPTQQTGSGNHQMAFRCGLSLKNDKLAWVPADNIQGRESAIETRAEGGYAVVSPSHCPKAEKHGVKHKQAYKVIQGDFARIPTITDRQASILLDLGRSLDETPLTEKEMQAAPLPPNRNGNVGEGVIDAFNQNFDIRTILERNKYERRGNRYLAPDSTTGLPGVHIFEDTGRCYSHHANDSLNDGHSHDSFSVFCIQEHGGDVRAAVKAAATELGIERPLDRPQPPPADDVAYDQAEREAIQKEAQAAEQKPTFEQAIILAQDFIALDIPPRKVHLSPWLMEASINMICGPRGIGKTMFAFSICESVARPAAFGAWGAGESVNVCYLDGELTMADIGERSSYFVQQNYLSNLYIYSDHYGNHLGLPSANLLDEDWRKAMKEFLLSRNIKLWCVDNIASLAPGIDENSKKDWDPINRFFLDLRFAGIGTTFVHHTGKEGQQRGTSGREDNIDISLMLSYPPNYSRTDGCKFVAKFTKARIRHRDLHLIGETEFTLMEDPQGNHVWTFKAARKATKIAVLTMLDEGINSKDIAETLEISPGRVSQIKTEAASEGLITKTGKLTQSGMAYVQN